MTTQSIQSIVYSLDYTCTKYAPRVIFDFFSILFTIRALPSRSLPSSISDLGSHSGPFSPVPAAICAFTFITRRVQLLFFHRRLVELYLPTLQGALNSRRQLIRFFVIALILYWTAPARSYRTRWMVPTEIDAFLTVSNREIVPGVPDSAWWYQRCGRRNRCGSHVSTTSNHRPCCLRPATRSRWRRQQTIHRGGNDKAYHFHYRLD